MTPIAPTTLPTYDDEVAFSSYNCAQDIALAARELGIPATIVVPQNAPTAKR